MRKLPDFTERYRFIAPVSPVHFAVRVRDWERLKRRIEQSTSYHSTLYLIGYYLLGVSVALIAGAIAAPSSELILGIPSRTLVSCIGVAVLICAGTMIFFGYRRTREAYDTEQSIDILMRTLESNYLHDPGESSGHLK